MADAAADVVGARSRPGEAGAPVGPLSAAVGSVGAQPQGIYDSGICRSFPV